MSQHKVVELKKQAEIEKDSLTDLLKTGARRLLLEAVEVELGDFLFEFKELMDDAGRQAVVRNGYLPEREILTGIGPVKVKVPKVRDRSKAGIKFNS